jgi:hypothetical protein
MHLAATSFLRDSYHHYSKLFSVLQFYSFNLFYLFNRSYCSLDICCCSLYLYVIVFFVSLCYCIQSGIHFVLLINPNQWYQSGFLFIYFSSCMSPTRSGYKKLGLEPVEPFQDRLRQSQQQIMGIEKKDDGAGDPFKLFLEEALA